MKLFCYLFVLSFVIFSCKMDNNKTAARPSGEELAIEWEHLGNTFDGSSQFKAEFRISNNSDQSFPNRGWTIYFNQQNSRIISKGSSENIDIQQIHGDYIRIKPTAAFQAIPPGGSSTLSYASRGSLISEALGPGGLYIVFDREDGSEQAAEALSDFRIIPFTKAAQSSRGPNDKMPLPTVEGRYRENANLSALAAGAFPKIIPSPKKVLSRSGKIPFDPSFEIHYAAGLESGAGFLAESLQGLFGRKVKSVQSGDQSSHAILLNTGTIDIDGQAIEKGANAYQLSILDGLGISIMGSDAAGVFYGIQSLLAWLPPEIWGQTNPVADVQQVVIQDAPRFSYRGMHLDVSRNFHSKESVLKLLDLMAFYKLNKFHFHLTDDEGWRLEIPELPELTELGSRRGHTHSEEDRLLPAYGSGPFPDPAVSHGNGYYSTEDFKEILQYAHRRHIEVIPEFDFPGHARAAIKSMQARFQKLAEQGREEEGKAHLLHDQDDRSEYKSVQDYTDNVICVCQESTYQFLEQVVQSTYDLYSEAGVPLNTIHIGGDEVPRGVWEKSPLCDKLIAQNPDINSVEELPYYFLRRVDAILDKFGLTTAGWEEIALHKEQSQANSRYLPNPEFVNANFQPYIWNNLSGNQDLGNRLANAGYPVILCNVSNLYFDLAYNKDPKEPGFHWGGMVNTRKAFEVVPEDVFKSTKEDNLGNPFDPEQFYATMESLTEEGLANILGIQGQLWSETLKGQAMLEYYLLPKMLGLAERAWAAQPGWAKIDQIEERETALQEAWNVFANAVGQRELTRLDYLFGGSDFRIPLPGALIRDGQLQANIAFPGLQIRYTTDGSEPASDSPLYKGPINVEGAVKLRAFSAKGRGSRTVEVFQSIQK